jgi:hypothetical protein
MPTDQAFIEENVLEDDDDEEDDDEYDILPFNKNCEIPIVLE